MYRLNWFVLKGLSVIRYFLQQTLTDNINTSHNLNMKSKLCVKVVPIKLKKGQICVIFSH